MILMGLLLSGVKFSRFNALAAVDKNKQILKKKGSKWMYLDVFATC
jgi:hypothetical protein